MDKAGNLYGTTGDGGIYFSGSVFKLTPSNGGWTYTSLHDSTGGSDGGNPFSIASEPSPQPKSMTVLPLIFSTKSSPSRIVSFDLPA
jgi:hypothetical protein